MPDFFDRLAARSAGLPGPQPRALPRLAHLFERAAAPEVEPEVTLNPLARTIVAVSPTVSLPGVVERHTETVHHERESHHSTVVERHLATVDTSVSSSDAIF